MPNLSSYIKGITIAKASTTPFARTYPAWTSILTGRHPVNHGARFNLQDEATLSDSNVYLPKIFKNNGYQTIYAADERRFSNLGEKQGFETVIGPRTGVSDFILGNFADFPSTNLLLLLPISQYILPELYANRAASHLYKPKSFSRLIYNTLTNLNHEKPTFMAVHFCLPHWPYTFIGHTPHPEYSEQPKYPANLIEVDKQIGLLMQNLDEFGLLYNSKIVFLSDHGENWGHFQTNLKDKNDSFLSDTDYGHGMNIFSPNSHNVLMAFKNFNLDQSNILLPTSLIDIAPTILDEFGMLKSKYTDTFDGRSLKRSNIIDIEQTFESGVILAQANTADPNPTAVAKSGAHRFIIRDDGSLRLRSELIQSMISAKQRGLRINNQGLFLVNSPLGYRWYQIDFENETFNVSDTLQQSIPPKLKDRFCHLYQSESKIIESNCVDM